MAKQVVSIGAGSIPDELRELADAIQSDPVGRAILVTESKCSVTLYAVGRSMDAIEIAGMLSCALAGATTPEDV